MNMGDFVPKSVVRREERIISTPFASKEAMNSIIGDIMVDNPWGCTPYMSGGTNHPGVQKGSENYSGVVIFENNDGKQVGRISIRTSNSAAFDTNVATVLANTAISTAMGGTASHDSSADVFSVSLKCHAENGELFNVTFKRDRIVLSSFESESILTTLETWADSVGALA